SGRRGATLPVPLRPADAGVLPFAVEPFATELFAAEPFAAEPFAAEPEGRARAPTGAALTRTAAMMHGSLPRTLQEWLVPRWTRTSPAFSSVSPRSRIAWISPRSTTM